MSIIKIIFIISLSLSFSLSSSSSSSSPPSSSNFNLTQILTNDPSHSFDIASSEFHSHQIDTEINPNSPVTIFVPDNKSFLYFSSAYHALPSDNIHFILKCHIIDIYFSPSRLLLAAKSHSTVARDVSGNTMFSLNLTVSANGSVLVSNNFYQAMVTRTLYDNYPIALYGVDNMLFPRYLPDPPIAADHSAAAAVCCFPFFFFYLFISFLLCI
ncbi:unnamed protein product [Trifolium pratense]|uniref:Uncharacterized protein n=1 Tax=Trifolium pratense TaxID=57577 RepID=A0ACB0JLU9_TRIPR|nr:unnamed protein product [Trifolium pratense]